MVVAFLSTWGEQAGLSFLYLCIRFPQHVGRASRAVFEGAFLSTWGEQAGLYCVVAFLSTWGEQAGLFLRISLQYVRRASMAQFVRV